LSKQYALEGGYMTGEVPGHVNFRTIAGDAATHPYAELFRDPREVQVAGHA
jgi:hypothetical protein